MRTEEFCDHQKLQADGAATGYENIFSGNDARLLHGFVNCVDWLDEGGFFESDIAGQRDHAAFGNPRHRFDIFSKAATVGRKAGRETSGFVLLALGERAAFAVKAGTAGNVMETHHAIAGLKFRHAGTDGNDGAGEFVAEDLRWLDVSLENFLDVGPADAAGGDSYKKFAFTYFGDGDFFDADNSLFAVDTCAHGFGDGAERLQRSGHNRTGSHRAATSRNSSGGRP